MKLLSLVLATILMAGCASVTQERMSPLSLTVFPFVFEIEPGVSQLQAFQSSGVSLSVGDIENGFTVFKDYPETLFADAPGKVGVRNREFLQRLVDPSFSSELGLKLKKVFSVSESEKLTVMEKGDWLFVITTTELGPTAYGASDSFDWVFQLNTSNDVDKLTSLIANMRLLEE